MKENKLPHPNLPLVRTEESFLHKSTLLILPPDVRLGAREERMLLNQTIPKNLSQRAVFAISHHDFKGAGEALGLLLDALYKGS